MSWVVMGLVRMDEGCLVLVVMGLVMMVWLRYRRVVLVCGVVLGVGVWSGIGRGCVDECR